MQVKVQVLIKKINTFSCISQYCLFL